MPNSTKHHWATFRIEKPPFSFRYKIRIPLLLLILSTLIMLVLIVNISVGEYTIPIDRVIATLMGEGTRAQTFAVMTLRLPRMIIAVLVGIALAVSGTILQGLTRNPLASPDIIGITNGASIGAVTTIILFAGAPLWSVPIAAFVSASIIALLIYWLSWHGGSSPTRLLLVGIGLSAISYAIVQILITQNNVIRVSQAQLWMVGSVYNRGWEYFWPLLPWVVIFVPIALFMARHLDALQLGDDLAKGLGSSLEWQRGLLLITSVALAGGAVAAAGTIGFVGLMAPHLARILVGPSHGGLLPVSALTGGLLVVTADLVGRTIAAPIEIPCGVITAAIGAPYFIWLLLRSRNI